MPCLGTASHIPPAIILVGVDQRGCQLKIERQDSRGTALELSQMPTVPYQNTYIHIQTLSMGIVSQARRVDDESRCRPWLEHHGNVHPTTIKSPNSLLPRHVIKKPQEAPKCISVHQRQSNPRHKYRWLGSLAHWTQQQWHTTIFASQRTPNRSTYVLESRS